MRRGRLVKRGIDGKIPLLARFLRSRLNKHICICLCLHDDTLSLHILDCCKVDCNIKLVCKCPNDKTVKSGPAMDSNGHPEIGKYS
jgi:hypothetical protein